MRIALITGASSGIGREFALQIPRLYKQLDEIWLVARRTERLKETAKTLDVPVRIFDGDLTRDYIYERIAKELDRENADIRMLVNAAGYGKIGDIRALDAKEQLGMVDLNCRALTKMTLLCLPYLSKGSRVVQMASAAAFAPQPGFSVYAATKSYVYSFSRGLGAELKDRGIIVTAVCPGPVETEFFRRAGTAPNLTKQSIMAEPEAVVHQALKDAAKGLSVSVYGTYMRLGRIAAKLLPAGLVMAVLQRGNKRQEE